MSKKIKFSLLIVGIILIGIGIYNLFWNSSISIDNNDNYITITLGFVAVVLAIVGGKTYK